MNSSEIKVKEINEFLKKFGTSETGVPKYRIVWSDFQTEIRIGTFREFYNTTFLREVTGPREVPKYPFIKERWLFEVFVPGFYANNPELPFSGAGQYECVYIFQDKDDKYLDPVFPVAEILVYKLENQEKPRSEKEITADLKKKEDDEVLKYMDYFGCGSAEERIAREDLEIQHFLENEINTNGLIN